MLIGVSEVIRNITLDTILNCGAGKTILGACGTTDRIIALSYSNIPTHTLTTVVLSLVCLWIGTLIAGETVGNVTVGTLVGIEIVAWGAFITQGSIAWITRNTSAFVFAVYTDSLRRQC